MKKLGLYLLGFIVSTVVFAACDDKSDLGIEQQNPQENIMQANGLTVGYGSAIAGNDINLGSYVDESIPVINTLEVVDLPADATVEYQMQVASTADFSDAQILNVTDGKVLCSAWNNAFQALYGLNPAARVNYIRFAAFVVDGNQLSRLGGEDFYYAAKSINVTPVDANLPVEAKYYLYVNGQSVEMSHSSQHQYDDPVFTAIIEVSAQEASQGYNWTIVNETYLQNAEAGKLYGVSETGDPADMSGNLVLGGVAGQIKNAGTYKMSVNMLDLTYTITYAFTELNTPGPANGWSFSDNMNLYTDDFVNYAGYVYVENEFKLAAGSWDVNWGGANGKLVPNGNNITVDKNGLYYITANLNENTYTLTYIETIGIIGGFNGWSAQQNLTPSADYKVWTVEATFPDANTEWKFRMNDDWDINLGGSLTDLRVNGDNIKTPEAGTYTITLNLGAYPYSCTVEAK